MLKKLFLFSIIYNPFLYSETSEVEQEKMRALLLQKETDLSCLGDKIGQYEQRILDILNTINAIYESMSPNEIAGLKEQIEKFNKKLNSICETAQIDDFFQKDLYNNTEHYTLITRIKSLLVRLIIEEEIIKHYYALYAKQFEEIAILDKRRTLLEKQY